MRALHLSASRCYLNITKVKLYIIALTAWALTWKEIQ